MQWLRAELNDPRSPADAYYSCATMHYIDYFQNIR